MFIFSLLGKLFGGLLSMGAVSFVGYSVYKPEILFSLFLNKAFDREIVIYGFTSDSSGLSTSSDTTSTEFEYQCKIAESKFDCKVDQLSSMGSNPRINVDKLRETTYPSQNQTQAKTTTPITKDQLKENDKIFTITTQSNNIGYWKSLEKKEIEIVGKGDDKKIYANIKMLFFTDSTGSFGQADYLIGKATIVPDDSSPLKKDAGKTFSCQWDLDLEEGKDKALSKGMDTASMTKFVECQVYDFSNYSIKHEHDATAFPNPSTESSEIKKDQYYLIKRTPTNDWFSSLRDLSAHGATISPLSRTISLTNNPETKVTVAKFSEIHSLIYDGKKHAFIFDTPKVVDTQQATS